MSQSSEPRSGWRRVFSVGSSDIGVYQNEKKGKEDEDFTLVGATTILFGGDSLWDYMKKRVPSENDVLEAAATSKLFVGDETTIAAQKSLSTTTVKYADPVDEVERDDVDDDEEDEDEQDSETFSGSDNENDEEAVFEDERE